MNLTNEAFDLIEKFDLEKITADKYVLGVYLDLLCEKDI
jgi:hypothetical protein